MSKTYFTYTSLNHSNRIHYVLSASGRDFSKQNSSGLPFSNMSTALRTCDLLRFGIVETTHCDNGSIFAFFLGCKSQVEVEGCICTCELGRNCHHFLLQPPLFLLHRHTGKVNITWRKQHKRYKCLHGAKITKYHMHKLWWNLYFIITYKSSSVLSSRVYTEIWEYKK